MLRKFITFGAVVAAGLSFEANGIVVSHVDTSCSEYEKYALVVDGNPYWPTSVQVRLDKLYGYNGWSDAAMEKVVAQAASDGFNTIGLPLHWREIEPRKDVFDWKILDKYLDWCDKYGLRTELLWFSWSSGGRVQYLWNYGGRKEPRTPDYVCSLSGTSEFNVLRKEWECSLDWRDTALRDREKYVMERLMAHIAERDKANGGTHTVIGIQLGNEARSHGANEATAREIIDYYSAVGEAVKQSDYVVWTRLNCVYGDTPGRIRANKEKRETEGTNIDFVGIDVYGGTPLQILGDVNGMLPESEGNYRMIMEAGANDSRSPLLQIAALVGDKAFSYYNYAVVDGNAMYGADGTALRPGGHVDNVRRRNLMLDMANSFVGSLAYGESLYVFNALGDALETEFADNGIGYKSYAGNQGLMICLPDNNIALLTTGQSEFIIPDHMTVESAAYGRFSADGSWVEERPAAFAGGKINMDDVSCILLHISNKAGIDDMLTDSAAGEMYTLSGFRVNDTDIHNSVVITKCRTGKYAKIIKR